MNDNGQYPARTPTATFYVDESIFPLRRQTYCHLWTDGSVEDLHEFAKRIGVARHWFESEHGKKGWNHYDLNVMQRAVAVAHGAKEMDRFAALEHFLRRGGKWDEEKHPALFKRMRQRREGVVKEESRAMGRNEVVLPGSDKTQTGP